MIHRILSAVALVMALLGPASAKGEKIALVVGVSAYRNVPVLKNTQNDAQDVAQVLKRLGFGVDLVIDPDRPTLEGAVRRLGARAQNAEAAVFYYAGHALEMGGRNWLVPATADIQGERDLRFEALDLDSVVEQSDRGARVTLILLDACRDNPFSRRLGGGGRDVRQTGLVPVPAGTGTLIAFATAPGTVALDGTGRNSPFTTALLKNIERPDLEVRQLMSEVRKEVRETTNGRQIPWENSALEGPFFFNPAPIAPPRPQATTPRRTAAGDEPSPAAMERLFWESIKDSTNPADFEAYLERFPNGVFAPIARNRLKSQREAQGRPGPPGQTAKDAKDSPDRPSVAALLKARLPLVLPNEPPQVAETIARDFEIGRYPRALAAARNGQWWRTSLREDRDRTVDAALEVCQVSNGRPCILIASDDQVEPEATLRSPTALRDMPRARYAGPFDPEQIPGAHLRTRQRPDVSGYRAAIGPKAVAYHPWNASTFVATGAPTPEAAEAQALEQCRADAALKRPTPRCFVYASGDEVVLPQRRSETRKGGDPAR
jgi:hypothetical protein